MLKNDMVYFLGIGGIGMSALARYFLKKGYRVAGYDRTSSNITCNLEKEGAMIHYHEDINVIPDEIAFVVMTAAIPADSIELLALKQRGVKIYKRAEILGMLSRKCNAICVSGTHGKTTTTSLITHILHCDRMKISAFIGGIANNFNSNVVICDADDKVMVVEADEYDHSFLQLSPYISIVTSIDADHLDIYYDNQHLIDSFNEFVNKTAVDGVVICRTNLPVVTERKMIVYGFENADIKADSIRIVDGMTEFHVTRCGLDLGVFRMPLFGEHNILNALASMTAAMEMGVGADVIREALSSFKGVWRRFDIRVNKNDTVYIDDYAHHPEEIKATLKTVRTVFPDRMMTVVFQPHLFSRTRDFLDGFAESLSIADRVILLDIYPAREKPIQGITSSVLLDRICCAEKMLCHKSELLNVLKKIHPELIVTMGAGDIDRLVPEIEEMLK